MIERIYISNFRTLVNCEIRLQAVSLLLGPNGSGKSSVFDVVDSVRRFVGGIGLASEVFPAAELTRWQKLEEQLFEIDLRGASGLFRYSLKLRHVPRRQDTFVIAEELTLDGAPLFGFCEGEIQLYNDRHERGPVIGYDPHRSGLSAIYARPDNVKLTEFKKRLDGVLFVRSCPPLMSTDSQDESDRLERTGANFASWYRFVLRQDIARQLDLMEQLRQVIDGFESLQLDGPADATVTLRVAMKAAGSPEALTYKFGELSDGQRQLILLHTLLYGLSDRQRILFLDEPDNYVSLREVQPWLNALTDAAGRAIDQSIIISHHPEVVDQLAREKGVWLTRESGGPTRVEYDKAADTGPLKPSQVEQRGW